VALLEALQLLLIAFDGGFKLTDIFCTALAECGLCLSVALLAFFRGSIYLDKKK
jgi:hypothetical protein